MFPEWAGETTQMRTLQRWGEVRGEKLGWVFVVIKTNPSNVKTANSSAGVGDNRQDKSALRGALLPKATF